MDMKPQEARSLLNKWRDESRAIHCIVKFDKGNTQLLGRITQLTDDQLTISGQGTKISLGEMFSASLSLSGADYDYIDGRHSPAQFINVQNYDALLTLAYRNSNTSVGISVLPSVEDLIQK